MAVEASPTRRLRRAAPALGLVALVGAGFVLGLGVRRFVADRPRREVAALLASTETATAAGAPDSRVLFVFRPIDCATALDVIDTWNTLHRRHPGLVLGAMIGTPRSVPDWKDIADVNGIEFPVRLISPAAATELLQKSGQPETPVSIVLGSEETIRAALTGSDAAVRRTILKPLER